MYHFIKPYFDFILSILLIISFLPIFLLLGFLLFFFNSGKVFFTQKRVGKNEKIFEIIKFRTMNDKKDEYGTLLPDKFRLTSIGIFLRKTSLDELPQLFNVLKGEMSLVGPRPLPDYYLPYYNDFQRKRHNIRPGITGWAQVNGRNAISWQQKFSYDIDYVKNMSFLWDVKILILTAIKWLDFQSVNEDGHATASDFKGNN